MFQGIKIHAHVADFYEISINKAAGNCGFVFYFLIDF